MNEQVIAQHYARAALEQQVLAALRAAGADPEHLGREARDTWAPGEWLGSDHTAPYLVPKQRYYDTHPEYFAISNGKRLPKGTLMQRMSLCLSNPEVHRIASRRMTEWMDLQNDRRFYYCSDADAEPCRCPECTAVDLLPHYCADRNLAWVKESSTSAWPT